MTAGSDDVRATWSDDDGASWRLLGVGSPIPTGSTHLLVYIFAPADGDGGTFYLDDIRWLDCGVTAAAAAPTS